MIRLFENIENYKQHFDELQEILSKGLYKIFGGFRKQLGR